jgi:3-oxoacyl-[acyl-carrier protein] reductase
MDLGIRGKRGLVCASSKGLGRGSAEALAAAGVDLVLNARGAAALAATAADISDRYGVRVQTVAGDITDAGARAEVLAAAGPTGAVTISCGQSMPTC